MRKSHGTSSKETHRTHVGASQEAEFNFGYFYRTIEEHLNTYAAQAGNPHSITDIALRVGRLLEAKALREELGASELVSQVRKNGAGTHRGEGSEPSEHEGLPSAALHVRARRHRTLSPEARKAISDAQRKRWKRAKRAAAGKEVKPKRTGEAFIIPWTEDDDAVIVEAAKSGWQSAPALANSLLPKLKRRTLGAIRQRIARLVVKGKLKQGHSKKGDGGVPHLMVEAA